MNRIIFLLKYFVLLLLIATLALAAWLYLAPPDMIRVASGFSAKTVCSNVFLAGRDGDTVLRVDVQAPGHPILRLIHTSVDRQKGIVRASLLSLFGERVAVMRPETGCALSPASSSVPVRKKAADFSADHAQHDDLWPAGDRVQLSPDPALISIVNREMSAATGTRAIVVVHDGHIVAESYAEGFAHDMPLPGWSMTKPVTAAIIGTLVGMGKLSLDQAGLFPEWRDDERRTILLADLLSMTSGLEWNEGYGSVSDVTRMLFLEPDMADFVRRKSLVAEPGSLFEYSSGTTVLLSRLWQNAVGDETLSLAYPRLALFGPLGMNSAVLETDFAGTYAGSSYLYATARDWARFGLFLLRDGVWNGKSILPQGFAAMMREPVPASDGEYGKGQVWLRGPSAGATEDEIPDAGFDLPGDTFWMLGHDGQSVAIIPSHGLVVVRLGLTPSSLRYRPQALVQALAMAVR